ncbi:hypothetical protein N7516_011296 [Penicillium verrucosum]|uniref:uncharacterized protein n=1 Tax=Penicillium verrucosum TaxID=60171 RepID=UPI0025452E73|nr:uncharacterized protein N7516_011296 [Penicillium verrucosum]KAJ5920438.1 hypothetical protein N7516_011296 [Penicillium verrucosum]
MAPPDLKVKAGKHPKASDEEFLLTLLKDMKVDHETAAKDIGITKAAFAYALSGCSKSTALRQRGRGPRDCL